MVARDGVVVDMANLQTDGHDNAAGGLALKLLGVAEYTVVDGDASLPEQIRPESDT